MISVLDSISHYRQRRDYSNRGGNRRTPSEIKAQIYQSRTDSYIPRERLIIPQEPLVMTAAGLRRKRDQIRRKMRR